MATPWLRGEQGVNALRLTFADLGCCHYQEPTRSCENVMHLSGQSPTFEKIETDRCGHSIGGTHYLFAAAELWNTSSSAAPAIHCTVAVNR